MLGRLNALNPDIDGLHGNESCPLNPAMPSAGSITVNSTAPYVIFSPDHSVPAITVQVSGMASAENTVKVATMDGFVLAAANIATDSQVPPQSGRLSFCAGRQCRLVSFLVGCV